MYSLAVKLHLWVCVTGFSRFLEYTFRKDEYTLCYFVQSTKVIPNIFCKILLYMPVFIPEYLKGRGKGQRGETGKRERHICSCFLQKRCLLGPFGNGHWILFNSLR